MIKKILSNEKTRVSAYDNYLLFEMSHIMTYPITKAIVDNEYFCITKHELNYLLLHTGNWKFGRALLENKAVDIRLIDVYSFKSICGNGNKECIMALREKITPVTELFFSTSIDMGFIEACRKGNTEVVKYILDEKLAYADCLYNIPIRLACSNNRVQVLILLLKDPKTLTAFSGPHCLNIACMSGYLDIVKLLLGDKRIDPLFNNAECLRKARYAKQQRVIDLLLSDERISPMRDDNSYT